MLVDSRGAARSSCGLVIVPYLNLPLVSTSTAISSTDLVSSVSAVCTSWSSADKYSGFMFKTCRIHSTNCCITVLSPTLIDDKNSCMSASVNPHAISSSVLRRAFTFRLYIRSIKGVIRPAFTSVLKCVTTALNKLPSSLRNGLFAGKKWFCATVAAWISSCSTVT